MDIILKGKKPLLDIEYFGQQSRFFEFFDKCISPLIKEGGIYAETNSGSNANAFMFARKGYKVIINDASEYSNSIARAIMSQDIPKFNKKLNIKWLNDYNDSYLKRAAVFAANISLYGYNSRIPEKLTEELKLTIEHYYNHLNRRKKENVKAYRIFNEDLFQYFKKLRQEKIVVDVMFMDFAWPWREDGSKTEEYDNTANNLSNIFEINRTKQIDIWDKTNVIKNVIKAIKEAQKVSKYVLLSNQSSNFPTPELLEVELLKNKIHYEMRHTMLTKAEYEDNLGKADFFREYLYVIKGYKLEDYNE